MTSAVLDQMAVFAEPSWRADLGVLAESTRSAARRYAADAFVLSSLAERVPAPRGTGVGAVPWQSFLREVAVARGLQDGAALREVQRALLLARQLPHVMQRLSCGAVTVLQAAALCDELVTADPAVVAEVDRQLADRLFALSPEAVKKETRRLVEQLDADAAADRAAKAAAGRGVRMSPGRDGQAGAWLNGPAIPMTRWYSALTETARALRQAGDPRGLDALRFDLVMGGFTLDDSAPTVVNAPVAEDVEDEADVPEALRAPTRDPAEPPTVQLALPADPGPPPPSREPGGVVEDCGPPPSCDGRAMPDQPRHDQPRNDTGVDPLPHDLLWRARAQAERVLEAAHAAEAEALHRVEQLRAEHDRLLALVVRERLQASSTLPTDCRASRPVQLLVHVPVTTLLGLANEPGYLQGYGWISAPQCRQLLPTAELRQVCTDHNGMVLDLAERAVRAGLSPTAAREALLRMATEAFTITAAASAEVDAHDPPPHLADLVRTRDRYCDGPLGTQVPAARSDLDHAVRHPDGPTAAWNLTARAKRSHRLKHSGWTPIRTTDHTLWTTPAGQTTMTSRHQHPPEPLAPDAQLPDPDAIHQHEARLLHTDDTDPDW